MRRKTPPRVSCHHKLRPMSSFHGGVWQKSGANRGRHWRTPNVRPLWRFRNNRGAMATMILGFFNLPLQDGARSFPAVATYSGHRATLRQGPLPTPRSFSCPGRGAACLVVRRSSNTAHPTRSHLWGLMVRNGAARLLTKRAGHLLRPHPEEPAIGGRLEGMAASGAREYGAVRRSRGAMRPSFASELSLVRQRARGKPGAGRTRSLACKMKKHTSGSHYRFDRAGPGLPRANGFNGFLRALPGDLALLPPSSARCKASSPT